VVVSGLLCSDFLRHTSGHVVAFELYDHVVVAIISRACRLLLDDASMRRNEEERRRLKRRRVGDEHTLGRSCILLRPSLLSVLSLVYALKTFSWQFWMCACFAFVGFHVSKRGKEKTYCVWQNMPSMLCADQTFSMGLIPARYTIFFLHA
jgi:hypothetical protein